MKPEALRTDLPPPLTRHQLGGIWRRLSRSSAGVAPLLAAAILIAAHSAWAQDPIAIDASGIVTVGKSITIGDSLTVRGAATVANTLTVNGGATMGNTLTVNGAATMGNTLTVNGAATMSNTLTVKGAATMGNTLTVNGAATVGNPSIILGGTHLVFNSANGVIDWGSAGTGSLYFRTLKNQGDPGAYTDLMSISSAGDLVAATINGEKAPYVFEVGGDRSDTVKWHHRLVESNIIAGYLGGPRGGTIRINFRVNNTDEVRSITESVYMEQNHKAPGVSGYTRQEGGGENPFTLMSGTRADVVPHPWDWIYARNYISPDVDGNGTPFPDYSLDFMTRPNVSATVILYDR